MVKATQIAMFNNFELIVFYGVLFSDTKNGRLPIYVALMFILEIFYGIQSYFKEIKNKRYFFFDSNMEPLFLSITYIYIYISHSKSIPINFFFLKKERIYTYPIKIILIKFIYINPIYSHDFYISIPITNFQKYYTCPHYIPTS